MKELNRHLICSVFAIAAAHCGGPIDGEDEFLADTEDAVLDEEADTGAITPPAEASDARFDQIAAAPRYHPYLSRVRLRAEVDCPDRIRDDMTIPIRCLDLRSGRHELAADVDVVGPETMVRFHTHRGLLADLISDAGNDCPVERLPNRIADLHEAHVRKFLASGFVKIPGGGRRYEVVFRRDGDVYRVLPARPAKEAGIVAAFWDVAKPGAGACLRPID